ncbi:MAG: TRAP transporter small permease subunit [Dehalococcoidia bacterium]|nr:TRAP transporter small permease subunit [Dehalococcoidia bacterium]
MAKAFVRTIEAAIDWNGKHVCFLAFALVFTISVDVFLRYVFNSPTKWSYDITYMIGGTLFLMSISYVLRHRGHVSIDIVRKKLPVKIGLAVDIALHLLLFFPLIGVLFYMSVDHALTSIAQRELSNVGFWRPPLYPFRTMIPVAFFLVLLQGLARFVTDVCSLMGKWEES